MARPARIRLLAATAAALGVATAAPALAGTAPAAHAPLARITTPLSEVVNGLHLELPCGLPTGATLACDAVINRSAKTAAAKTAAAKPAAAAAAPSGLGPADIQSAYKLPAATGTPTVAIVDAQDDPNAESDLATYRSTYGLPSCTTANGCFRKVNQTGGTTYPSGDTGWGTEITLDLDAVSAACPGCHILLVEATSATTPNLGAAVNYAATQPGVVAISNSYGGAESSTSQSDSAAYYKHPGIAVTVSAGDSGYGVEFPASSSYVTAVGGTKLTKASNARGWTETVWGAAPTGLQTLLGSNPDGTGSGCSAQIAKPTWQKDTGCAKRTVADVAAVADPASGLAIYDTYGENGWLVVGGTSLSSPLIAAVYALAGNAASTTYGSYPYSHSGALFDVTSGANGACSGSYLCTGGTGYDGPTGLGTPNGTAAF